MDKKTEVKHTPGPWGMSIAGKTMATYSQSHAIYQEGRPNLIAGIFYDVEGGIETAKANARLIAAAPQLVEAAKEMLCWDPDGATPLCQPFEKLKDALKQAGVL